MELYLLAYKQMKSTINAVKVKSEEAEKSHKFVEKDFIRSHNEQHQRPVTSVSVNSLVDNHRNDLPTADVDYLHRFGQETIFVEQDKTLAKALIQVFHESKKEPDVQPSRNNRRTLKLSKSDVQGYGFWLQTYDFGDMDNGKKRTFVRYVEDEGPAYLSGLREGDIITEVNGHNVEDEDHMKIVDLISATSKNLILVVKFMDMVRRVELVVRLKKYQSRLFDKMEELKNVINEEEELYKVKEKCKDDEDDVTNRLSTYSSSYSSSAEAHLDRLSMMDTSSESGLGSLSSIFDDAIFKNNNFDKRSSFGSGSMKALYCSCTSQKTSTNNTITASISDKRTKYPKISATHSISCRSKRPLKRTESMPVQKCNILERRLSLDKCSCKNRLVLL